MKLHHRLIKLERLQPPPSCHGCGYPATARIQYVITRNSDPLPTCPVCHRPLGEDGAPIDGPYKRIILDRGDVV